MFRFKNKTADQQYKIISQYMNQLQYICIKISETNPSDYSKLSYEEIAEIESLPILADKLTTLIYSSKLSDNFKRILIDDVCLKMRILNKNKTR